MVITNKDLASNLDHVHVFIACTDFSSSLKTDYRFVSYLLGYSCIVYCDMKAVQFIHP